MAHHRDELMASTYSLPSAHSQGDEFVAGLVEGSMLQGDRFTCLRLSACGISDEGACNLARALERVGECLSVCVYPVKHTSACSAHQLVQARSI